MKGENKKVSVVLAIAPLALAIVFAASAPVVMLHASSGFWENCRQYLNFWQHVFTQEVPAPFAWYSLACFTLSGFFWHRSSGWKKAWYYLFVLLFAVLIGYGSMNYDLGLNFSMPGNSREEQEDPTPVWIALGALLLLLLASAFVFRVVSRRPRI